AAHQRNHGRLGEARALAERALALDPLAFSSQFEMLLVDFMERRYDETVRRADELIALGPPSPMTHFIKARALVETGRYDLALAELERMPGGGARRPALTLRGYIYGAIGDRKGAGEVLRRLTGDPGGTSVAYDRAVVHLGLREWDRCLAAMAEAIAARDPRARLLAEEPMFDPLRADPRFGALLAQAGLRSAGA